MKTQIKTLVFGFTLFSVSLLFAQVPQLINYQGMITDNEGKFLTGNHSIQFKIYESEAGDAFLWSETQSVEVHNGLFSVLLGSITPVPFSLFDGHDKYLALTVDDDKEMEPRKRLVSVGYSFHAYNADKLDGLDAVAFLNTDNDYGRQGVASELFEGITRLSDKYVNEGQPGAITSSMLQDNAITNQKLAENAVTNNKLADNSVTSEKVAIHSIEAWNIKDEPGIARQKNHDVPVAKSGVTNVITCSISAPKDGYIVARGYAIAYLEAVAFQGMGDVAVGITRGASEDPTYGNNEWTQAGYANTGVFGAGLIYSTSLSVERTYSVTAGDHTFYINAIRPNNQGNARLYCIKLLLTYFPTGYGGVQILHVLSEEGGQK